MAWPRFKRILERRKLNPYKVKVIMIKMLPLYQAIPFMELLGYANEKEFHLGKFISSFRLAYEIYIRRSTIFIEGVDVPDFRVFIIPSINEDRWLVWNTKFNLEEVCENPVFLPTLKDALRHCYSEFLLEKAYGTFHVEWKGPDPKEFLGGNN